MGLLGRLALDDLTPSQLWEAIEPDTRGAAARAVYARGDRDRAARQEADRAIAGAMRFRDTFVRRLPIEKRVAYLSRSVRPDDSLAASLLTGLHLEHRRELLELFLDRLGIPHEDGLIDDDHELEPPDKTVLGPAVDALYERFPSEHADLYVASLIALDSEVWAGLIEIVRRRAT